MLANRYLRGKAAFNDTDSDTDTDILKDVGVSGESARQCNRE